MFTQIIIYTKYFYTLRHKESPIEHPLYGAKYWVAALSPAVALTITVNLAQLLSNKTFEILATEDFFWPIAT